MSLGSLLGIGKLGSKAYDAYQMRKAAKKGKMVNKIISKILGTMGMGKISKMVAVPVGALVGFLVLKLPFLAPLITEEWTTMITVTIATAIVGMFPANTA